MALALFPNSPNAIRVTPSRHPVSADMNEMGCVCRHRSILVLPITKASCQRNEASTCNDDTLGPHPSQAMTKHVLHRTTTTFQTTVGRESRDA